MRFKMKTAFLLMVTCVAGLGNTLVIPNNQSNAAGNAALPLGAAANRFQEVVGSGQFTVPILITGVRLRAADCNFHGEGILRHAAAQAPREGGFMLDDKDPHCGTRRAAVLRLL